jgi:hypothetical protein
MRFSLESPALSTAFPAQAGNQLRREGAQHADHSITFFAEYAPANSPSK